MFQKIKDRSRQIFRYWDGAKWRRADPAVIDQRLAACECCNFESNLNLFNPTKGFPADKFGQEAYDELIKGTKEVFQVDAIGDRGGLTEIELIGLLSTFYAFRGALKKSYSLRPILSPTPESAPSAGSATPLSMASA